MPFWITCLFNLFLRYLSKVSKIFSSFSQFYNNYKHEQWKRLLKTLFFERFLLKDVYLGQ